MKDVNIFIAEPSNRNAGVAVSAFARAMKEMNKVAIVRCVFRQGQSNVVIGVLTPNVSENENIVSLTFCFLFPLGVCFRQGQSSPVILCRHSHRWLVGSQWAA